MPTGAELSSAALQWLTGSTSSVGESLRSEKLSCYIRTQVIELLRLWLLKGDGLRSALDDAELLARMAEFVSETENIDSGIRTEEEHVIVESIRSWWTLLTDRILASTKSTLVVSLDDTGEATDYEKDDPPGADTDLDAILAEPPSSGEELLGLLAGVGRTLVSGISATVSLEYVGIYRDIVLVIFSKPQDLHTVCGVIERQSRDPLGWYLCEVVPSRSRQERHQVQIACPHRTFRQRLGAPAHGLPRFQTLLPASVQTALDGYQDVKLWLIKAIIATGRASNVRAGLLTALFEALARSNNPETIERLEKRASIASLSALTASSSSITVPSFVEAVVTDVLLDPIVRLELDVWNIAVKSFIGRPDDLVGILSTARLRYSGETRSASTPDVGKCTGLSCSTRMISRLMTTPFS
jgi:hypothetical protein